ncbi:hypothetical protein BKA70DRAFT_1235230 [Coprinopsis sp. MPI-PUGE-AT-0042]|nr:hypothetical protein BKA70DRAFT_1235230 [Coprinopsis sp. MPI-PUGE-AT-0042]
MLPTIRSQPAVQASAVALVRIAERDRMNFRMYLENVETVCDSARCRRDPSLCTVDFRAMACSDCAEEGTTCPYRREYVIQALAEGTGWPESYATEWYEEFNAQLTEVVDEKPLLSAAGLLEGLHKMEKLSTELEARAEEQTDQLRSMNGMVEDMKEAITVYTNYAEDTVRRLGALSDGMLKISEAIDGSRYGRGRKVAIRSDADAFRAIVSVVRALDLSILLEGDEDKRSLGTDVRGGQTRNQIRKSSPTMPKSRGEIASNSEPPLLKHPSLDRPRNAQTVVNKKIGRDEDIVPPSKGPLDGAPGLLQVRRPRCGRRPDAKDIVWPGGPDMHIPRQTPAQRMYSRDRCRSNQIIL